MAATMTKSEAQATHAARGNEARLLHRKSKHELVAIYQSEGGYGGGNWSKQDLESSILEHRYPVARYNEATHVLYHVVGGWDACEFCQQESGGEAQRIAEVYADARAEQDRGL